MTLSFRIGAAESIEPEIERVVLAGFAGRSQEEVEAHIEEVARHGIRRPSIVPSLWPVLPRLITQSRAIDVYGADTAPEVEYVLFTWQGSTYVTVGNDQCDIELERIGLAEKSKNICQKVVAHEAWRLNDVLPHWDDLLLKLTCNTVVMQEGRLAGLLRPEVLLEKVAHADGAKHERRMVFSGTIATAGIYPTDPYRISMTLADPVGGLDIAHEFTVKMLAPLI